MANTPLVNNEEFVKAWMTSKNIKEVARKTGMTPDACSSRASYLRNVGVRIPRFQKTWQKVDVEGLNTIVLGAKAGKFNS